MTGKSQIPTRQSHVHVLIKVSSKYTNWCIHRECLVVLLLDSSCISYCQLFTHWPDMYWRFLSIHNCALFLDRMTNWIFNRTCILGHNHIVLPVLHRHTISFFQIYITWFLSCVSNFIKWWGLGLHALIIHRNLTGLLLLLTNVL